MPPQPVIPKWVRLVVKLLHESNTMILGWDFQPTASGPYTNTQLGDLAAGIWTAAGTSLLACMTAQWTVTAVEATDRSVVGGAFAAYTPSPNVGTRTGDALPANCALVISKRTGYSGRVNHGRMYLPGANDGDAAQSIMSNAYMISANLLAAQLLSYGGPVSLPGEWSFPSIKQLAMKTITSTIIDNVLDSQRRRLPGRGY